MTDDECNCKVLKETDEMELLEVEDDCYKICLWARGITVVLNEEELEELKKLLK